MRSESTCAATTLSDFHALQSCRVRSSGSRPGYPVHLVRADARLVLAVEEPEVALAEQLEPALGDEPLLDDQEAVALERLDLLVRRTSRSGARPRLVRVVEREADDGRRDALLEAVELADLERRPELRVLDRHSRERDVLLEDRAARPARDDADALAADVDLVAVTGGLVPLELEPDERALRMRVALLERGASDEVVVGPQVDGEADARPRTGRPGRRTRTRRR